MKVKIGNKIYDSENEPIMVILSDNDKSNIANMHQDCTKYCSFPDSADKDLIEWFMTDNIITFEQSNEANKELFKEMMKELGKHPEIITLPKGGKIKWLNLSPNPPPPRTVKNSKSPFKTFYRDDNGIFFGKRTNAIIFWFMIISFLCITIKVLQEYNII